MVGLEIAAPTQPVEVGEALQLSALALDKTEPVAQRNLAGPTPR